ncbi:MAG TPA: YeeE/YedE family protein [Hyphomicrobiaceae bacterium]|jgi:uncharacterized membrane protein YedE/YeeE|nr:YeeE/YedE family protein [Hyphomicrobiaceae bacterium]
MSAIREALTSNAPLSLALGGLLIGALFGAVVFRTNYCAMGSLSDIYNFGDYRRFRAWLLAAATALLGAQLLQRGGVVALDKSMYLAPNLNWVGNAVGGLVLGIGMVLAGGCPSRNLARAGAGDLRALITLMVLGLSAYMAIGGVLGPMRARIEAATAVRLGLESQGLDHLLSALLRAPPAAANLLATLVLAGGAFAYCLADKKFRASSVHILSGLAVGACVIAGWALTGLAIDEFAPRPLQPVSLTYIRPTGDALEWLQRFTAEPVPSFGVSSVFGALIGAGSAAAAMGRFRLIGFSDTADMVRNLLGAALMGVGGVLALGCTVGQAITGVSTLASGSLLTFAAIVVGGFWGLRLLERTLLDAN